MRTRMNINGVLIAAMAIALSLVSTGSSAAADPPGRVDFQGMARDAGGTVLNGPVAMVFRFYDDPSAGTILWEEIHDPTVHPPAVSVSEGLFTLALGNPAHRTAGSEASFQDVFANHSAVYLGVQVGEDPEMTPRISVASAPFAVNSDALDGKSSADFANSTHTHAGAEVTSAVANSTNSANADKLDNLDSTAFADAVHTHTGSQVTGTVANATNASNADMLDNHVSSFFLDISPVIQTKMGKLVLDAAAGSYGIEAYGPSAGGYFKDKDGSGYAYAGYGETGIWAYGNTSGGYFKDSDASGYAYVGVMDNGINAFGNSAGGYFKDLDHTGEAYVGFGNTGISAAGSGAGGYFLDSDSGGYAYAGQGDKGISAQGKEMGGYFKDADHSGYAKVGYGDYGIDARGNQAGGYFEDLTGLGCAYVGYGTYGIQASGADAGGHFIDQQGTSWCFAGRDNSGVSCYGAYRGGYFEDLDNSAIAHVAYNDTGIEASGSYTGGSFASGGLVAHVARTIYKIISSGTCAFIQNHPYDPRLTITYTAPESAEVATYTRGTAKLENGEARVVLDKTFQWVTNPDIGLTASVTPVGEWSDLYVVEKATTHLLVRSVGGSHEASFDYIVYGLRIGFEEASVVQEKERECFIPSFKTHREQYARHPEFRAFNALERYKVMEVEARGAVFGEGDFSRARALKEAIHEFDPAVDEPVGEQLEAADARLSGMRPATSTGTAPAAVSIRRRDPEEFQAPVTTAASSMVANQPALAHSVSSPPYLAASWPVCETVEAGDLLVTEAKHPGHLCLSAVPNDPGVVGVAASASDAQPEGLESASAGILRASVAVAGMIQVKADAAYGVIALNDLLVASPTPGHAMRAQSPAPGTVVGKALEPLETGTGLIRVLVMLR